VVDLRLYRISFIPAIAALVALLFSLQSQPGPLRPLVAPAGFERGPAADYARQIATEAPDRTPGSEGDTKAAALVEHTFKAVTSGQLVVQHYGDGGDLTNVILRLPGESRNEVVLIAPRDTASPPGAASSAAATGALEELASGIGTSQHTKTIVLVSTDGASEGASGAAALVDSYLDPSLVNAIVTLEQPGAATPHQPYVLDSSTGAQSASIQLVRTAELSLLDQTGLHAHEPGPFGQLAALALPGGLGEQAVLIARGLESVGISSAGERPLPPDQDQLDDFSPKTMDEFGRAAFDLVLALDAAPGSPVHGPDAYLEVGGNLIPGWALAVLALALLIPALVAAVDALARAGRRGSARAAIGWASVRSVPLLAALALLYAMAIVGVVPRPSFPFDPGRYGVGPSEVLALAALVLTALGVWWWLGRNRMPVLMAPEGGASALGLLAGIALLAVWIVNPYLALLLVPLAHPWVFEARAGRRARRPKRWPVSVAVAVALVPLLLGALSVAGRLDLDAGVVWSLALSIGDFGVRIPIAIAACVLAGSVAALVLVAGAGSEAGPPGPSRPARRRAREDAETEAGATPQGPRREAWTNSLSGRGESEPIYDTEQTNRPTTGNGDERIAPGGENRAFDGTDQRRGIPSRRAGGRTRDAEEGDADQARADPARERPS
ncbi:MAG TPA: hypothetical protein VGI54_06555, partial [Solirubrobacteraceae bacterium]|jgi:hypothetical protein